MERASRPPGSATDEGPADRGPADEGPADEGPATDEGPTTDETDEVDRLVADWARERPDLDVAPLEVLSRVSRLARHLDRERRAALGAHGLEQWSFDVLAALRRAGPPHQLPPRTLLHQTLVSSGAMTNRIDRLEEAGLVERHRDPDDRRGVLVRLTPGGRRRVDASLTDLLRREQALLDVLGAPERTQLAGALRQMLLLFDQPTAAR